MMERLTKRTVMGIVGNNASIENYPLYKIAQYDELDHGITAQCFNKLAEYEDLEEQGLLLRLPCKVGDTVYAIGFNNNRPLVYESVVLSILITEKEIVFNVKVDEFEINSQLKQSMFGKTVFLTQAEAEQKLKEMDGD